MFFFLCFFVHHFQLYFLFSFLSGAWPVLIDDFVEYARPLIQGCQSTTVWMFHSLVNLVSTASVPTSQSLHLIQPPPPPTTITTLKGAVEMTSDQVTSPPTHPTHPLPLATCGFSQPLTNKQKGFLCSYWIVFYLDLISAGTFFPSHKRRLKHSEKNCRKQMEIKDKKQQILKLISFLSLKNCRNMWIL